MTITNGYTDGTTFKARLMPTGASFDAVDDGFIDGLITKVSRYIDGWTDRTFYARTETHYYDTPLDPFELFIHDDDLISITTLTNGFGGVMTTAQYKLYPLNTSPKHTIKILYTSGLWWQTSTLGNPEGAISIVGSWGYSATTPPDIALACEDICVNIYQNRYGENVQGRAQVTGAGIVITPQDVSQIAADTLNSYRRVV